MSRKEIVGEKFTIAFGIDVITGAFVQLWKNPADDQDCAFVIIDSDGVRIDEDLAGDSLHDELRTYLVNKVTSAFKRYKETHQDRPNIDEAIVITLAQRAGGFPDISADVYRVFGDDA